MTGDDVRGEKPCPQRQTAAVHHRAGRPGCLPCATSVFPSRAISLQRPALAGATRGADEALRPTMLRQIVRACFLVGKSRIERLAGHGFFVFPSGWHGQDNTKTLPVGKPRRTTSCVAAPKGISLPAAYVTSSTSLLCAVNWRWRKERAPMPEKIAATRT